jgi:hypothetical protein
MGNWFASGSARSFAKSAACALALAALAAPIVQAEEAPAAPVPTQSDEAGLARLESAFWACDYVATTEGVHATPIAVCRYVTEELKQVKFAGSFTQLLEWWRANKVAEHRRIARLAAQ